MYSLEREKQLGETLAEQAAKSSKFVTDPDIMNYVKEVDQHVERNSDKHLPMTLHLIDNDTIGSYTLPAGQLFVTRGPSSPHGERRRTGEYACAGNRDHRAAV